MPKPEAEFEYRIRKILTTRGYLVVKCGASRPFDLVAIKNQYAYPIEVKARKTRYSPKQGLQQKKIIDACSSSFFVIKQSESRGKMILTEGTGTRRAGILLMKLKDDLQEYLI